MAATQNETKLKNGNETENTEPKNGATKEKKWFTPLLLLAVPLSIGSLIWTTYSLLDFFKVGGIDTGGLRLEDIGIVGLSAAATADIAWSATIVAEYREVRLTRSRLGFGGQDDKQENLLPYIGWIEVLLVTLMLAIHGHSMGSGEAAFAAALPVLTKLSWMMVISDLKDESDLTEEQKRKAAQQRRESKMLREETEATADAHAAKMEKMRRENEAQRERDKAEAEAKLEAERTQAEIAKLEAQSKFELEQMRLRADADLKLLRQNLNAEVQLATLRGQQEIQLTRLDAEQELALRAPIGNMIIGQVVRPQQRQLGGQANGGEQEGDESWIPSLVQYGLTEAEMKRASLALSYYTINAQHGGGITKTEFCRVNGVNPPRLSEATGAFPAEWFETRGLATWANQG